jgi:predicted ATPase
MENKKRKWEDEPSGSADRTFLIPYGRNLRFFGRDKELQSVKEALEPGTRFRAIGIHGLGGVGKTQLALQYANTSLDVYQVIAWIQADTQTNIVHALSNFAKKLGLADGASDDDRENIGKVRDWLNTTSKPFLLVFDDVDKIEILDQIWPASDRGSIIITTRSPWVASGRTTTTLAVSSFSADTSSKVLRSLSGLEFADDKESAAAYTILCRWTSGLPLAVMQMSNFIRNRGSSYVETEKMLQDSESARKAYIRAEPPAEYHHTLTTVWSTSYQRLSPEATALLHLLSCLDAVPVPERLITGKTAEVYGTPLKFALDSFS